MNFYFYDQKLSRNGTREEEISLWDGVVSINKGELAWMDLLSKYNF